MKILVTAATEMELMLLQKMNLPVGFFISGVGLASTIFNLSKKLFSEKFDLIIQVGIAGSFDLNKFPILETVVVEKDRFADFGAFENNGFSTLAEMNLENENEFPFKNGWLINTNSDFNNELHKVNSISVAAIQESKLINEIFKNKYQPDIETMEGAAFHYVCLQMNIPFLQIRTISNLVGDRDKSNWKMKEALEKNANAVGKILSKL